MKFTIILSFICIFFTSLQAFDINIANIIKDFFILKNIRNGLILTCYNQYDMVHILKQIWNYEFSNIAIQNIDENVFNNYTHTKLFMENYIKSTLYHKSGIILDIECSNKNVIIQVSSILEMYNEIHNWLMLGSDLNSTKELLQKTELRLDSEVLLVLKKYFKYELWPIYDVYNPGSNLGGTLNISFYGYWKPFRNEDYHNDVLLNHQETPTIVKNWILFLTNSKMVRRRNLHKLLMNAVIVAAKKPPKTLIKYVSSMENRHLDTMHRYGYNIYLVLMEMFNFRVKLLRTNTWGTIKNGSWTGVMGALIHRQAEVSITPLQFKIERVGLIDSTSIFYLCNVDIIFKHPKNYGLKNAFIQPLTYQVWWSTFVVIVLTAIIFKIVMRKEVYIFRNNEELYKESKFINSWSYITMIAIIGSLCQQGQSHQPNTYTCRLVTMVMLIFTFLLYQFYSASIVSSLLMEPPRTIKNVDDIVKSNFIVLMEDIAYNYYDFFDSTTNPNARKLYRKKILVQGVKNSYVKADYGIKKVNEGGYALYIDIDTAYKIIAETFDEQSVCSLGQVTVLPPRGVQLVTRKASPYREMIAYGLRKIHETGIMQYHTLIWQASKPKCAPNASKQTFNIALIDTATAFLILVAGFSASLLILFIELLSNFLKNINFHPEN